jgi:hypothetical protein
MGEAENKNIKIIIQNIKSTQVTLSFILWVTFYDTGRFFSNGWLNELGSWIT